MPFTQDAWTRIASMYDRITGLPFLQELSEGTLEPQRFQHYILQDSLYLVEFARVLSILAARAPDPSLILTFSAAAQQAIVVERALHSGFFARSGLTEAMIDQTEPTPACLGYTSFLLSCGYRYPIEAGVAAVLPCFWIYQEVGTRIHQRSVSNNPYQDWIDTYADKDFAEAVHTMKSIADQLAGTTSAEVRNQMLECFHRSTRYEWMFWDSAYRLETWPVP